MKKKVKFTDDKNRLVIMITDEVNIDREVEEHLGHMKMHWKSG